MTASRIGLLLSCLVVFACSDDGVHSNGGPQCNDGIDNDGDGMKDFPEDPGCTSLDDETEDSLVAPQCADGRDNDGDGITDWPNDPGCSYPNQDDESDDCPSGPMCPQCGNGVDDDNNGATDYKGGDTGCLSAADPTEVMDDPFACGSGLKIEPLPVNGIAMGTFNMAMSSSPIMSPCGEASGVPAVAYVFETSEPIVLYATTGAGRSAADTVLDLRKADCDGGGAEIACSDDISDTDNGSEITQSLAPGKYYLVVKARNAGETLAYMVETQRFAGEGVACTTTPMCGPGLVCRVPHNQTAMVCAKPVCSDGVDDDGDTKMDYPADPGCDSPDDTDEMDDCPSGPNCPQCANGVDDDLDTKTDYPMDTSCTAASSQSEACSGEMDPIQALTGPVLHTTLIGAHDDRTPSCDSFSGGGLDRLYTVKVPAMASLTLTAGAGVDTLLSVMTAACVQPDLVCVDNGISAGETVTLTDLAAGTYIAEVDTYSSFTTPAAFDMSVSGTIAGGGSCEPADTLGGALACAATNPCITNGMGKKVCKPNECGDGIDNDTDGRMDYPNDPGCTSLQDATETDTCNLATGVGCPQCSDKIDNDGVNGKDYPADLNCDSAADGAEVQQVCGETDASPPIVGPSTTGTTVGLHDDRLYDSATCNLTAGQLTGGNDIAYIVTVPATATLTFDTVGSALDTVIALFNFPGCAEPSLYCDDEAGTSHGGSTGDSWLQVTNLAAGTYILRVDGWSSTPNTFTVHTAGTIAAGGGCDTDETLGGALVCVAGKTCMGTAPNKTCQ